MSANQYGKPRKDSFFNLYFTSTISIALALFMVGLVAFLLLWASHTAKYTKENVVIALVLRDSTQNSDIQRVENYLKSVDFVKQYKYISKEEALTEYIKNNDDDPTELLDFNPFNASIEVNLNAEFANENSLKEIEPKLKTYDFIEDVVYQKDMISALNVNVQRISIILLLASALLLLITIILINNTIRISIYSKRFIINTMKLVGARAWFIRKPFINRFVINGLIASFLASAGLFGIGYYLKQLDSSLPLYDWHFYAPIVALIFVSGFIISFLAALFGINKYIRMKSDDLYFI
ncbi:MAG: permease-like cell division protein FtsX [Prevotellaceae bacterium]|jgi:cell division transport system permease protein|nr:permease-like cell division protein FtsX [Prevotellaceae bacterium]